MQQDPKIVIIAILEVAGIKENTDFYANEFDILCRKQSIIETVKSLPEEKQQELKKDMAALSDQSQLKEVINKYISGEQYEKALNEAAGATFVQFVNTLLPTLTQEQITNLQAYMQSVQATSS